MAARDDGFPDLAGMLAPVLQSVAADERPLLVAIAERMAAERYRDWASRVADPVRSAGLRACAAREEEIARRVEARREGADALQRDLRARVPDLGALYESIFTGRTLEQQWAVQARGERLGAATWRAFAATESDATARDTYLGLALLEEESAAFLESLLP